MKFVNKFHDWKQDILWNFTLKIEIRYPFFLCDTICEEINLNSIATLFFVHESMEQLVNGRKKRA